MPRSLRIEFPGAFYHVMARGNRRETIFHDDDDRRFFLATLSEACAMTGWRVHAWVLMGNHYHLFIETPEANLVAGMSWLQNTVTRRYNVRHMAWGRLFGDRYKAVLVEGADSYHYRTLADYIKRMWMPGAAICGAVGIGEARSSPGSCASFRKN
ncbi:MAG: transposase [Akkermansiaceae bacterium]|nr:transposase [Akkermansiaceae bacterium]